MPASASLARAGRLISFRDILNGLSVSSQIKNQVQDIAENAVTAIRVSPILIATVVAILVSATEAFTEIVLILCDIDIVSVVSVAGILIRIAVIGIELPTVLSIG